MTFSVIMNDIMNDINDKMPFPLHKQREHRPGQFSPKVHVSENRTGGGRESPKFTM